MTTMLSLILAFMLSIGGSPAASVNVNPAGCPGDTGIQAPIDNNPTINRFFDDYREKTASRPISKKILEIPLIKQPKKQIRLRFSLSLKEELRLVGYKDSMNLYQAFGMNPVNFTDPFGLRRIRTFKYLGVNYIANVPEIWEIRAGQLDFSFKAVDDEGKPVLRRYWLFGKTKFKFPGEWEDEFYFSQAQAEEELFRAKGINLGLFRLNSPLSREFLEQLYGFSLDSFAVSSGKLYFRSLKRNAPQIAISIVAGYAMMAEANLARSASNKFQNNSRMVQSINEMDDLLLNMQKRVPGGGLASHEAAGGHTISRHVAKTETELAQRLVSQPRIPGASTFFDMSTAEAAVADAIAMEQANINTWLQSSYRRYTFSKPLSRDVGIYLKRNASHSIKAWKVRIVLERDPNMQTGYKIITSYPE